ncbi:hypothetical protein Fot_24783 [Forsythia ovata]|uniref:Uncharacterized protein n=1 Tax=Forsythia ovata TaxID=205694 RepID=A0ABD1U761_9LAMI
MQDQNCICKNILATTEQYGVKVEDYNKKVNDLTSLAERLEAKVERRSKKVEKYKNSLKAERLRADVNCLATILFTSHARAKEREEKLQQEIEKKREEINLLYVQQKSWKEDLVQKDKELGIQYKKNYLVFFNTLIFVTTIFIWSLKN